MAETSGRERSPRLRSLSRVVLGAVCFLLIMRLVGRSIALLCQGRFPETPRTLVTVRLSSAAIGEIVLLILLVLWLRWHGRSLRDLGLWRASPLRGWIVGAIFTGLYLASTFLGPLRGHAALGEVSFFHIYNALIAGVVAGSVEEIFFRGFVMSELRWSGFGTTVQVIASGVLFGIAHFGWGLVSGKIDWPALAGAVIATTILGLMYAITYRVSRYSLMPVIAGHLVMDVIIEPWLLLAAVTGVMGHSH